MSKARSTTSKRTRKCFISFLIAIQMRGGSQPLKTSTVATIPLPSILVP